MIDRQIFNREFSLLFERFGRNPETVSDLLITTYLQFLDQHLKTNEFVTAARHIFNEDQFFPSPRRFVDAIHGNAKENAERAWQEVLQLAQAGNSDLSTLPPATREAIKAAGGWRAIAYAESEFQLSQVRKAFQNAITDTSALPAAPQLEANTIEILG